MDLFVARIKGVRASISAVGSLADAFQRYRDDASPCSPMYGDRLYEQACNIRDALDDVCERVDTLFREEARKPRPCECHSHYLRWEMEEAAAPDRRARACPCVYQSDAIRERCPCSREAGRVGFQGTDDDGGGGSGCGYALARSALGCMTRSRYLRLGAGAVAKPSRTAAEAADAEMIELLFVMVDADDDDDDEGAQQKQQQAARHCVTVSSVIARVAEEAVACVHAMIDVLSYNRMHHYQGSLGQHVRGMGRALLRSFLCIDACITYSSGAIFSGIIPELEDAASALQNVLASVASWSPLGDCTAP